MTTHSKYLQLIIALGTGLLLPCFLWLMPPLPDIDSLLLRVLVYGALLEEMLKVTVGLALVRGFHFTPLSTLMIGLGFGLGEQSLHVYHNDPIVFSTIAMHTITGIVVLYLLRKSPALNIFYIILAAVAVHAVYNISLWTYLVSTF